MVRVILKRIGLAFLTLFGVTVIVFALLQMMPGEPIDSIVPLDASEELRQVIIDQYGFDQPLYMQYFMWLGNAVRGNFGNSVSDNRLVLSVVSEALHNTLILALGASIFAFLLSILIGVYSSYRPNSIFSWIGTVFGIGGISIPNYCLSTNSSIWKSICYVFMVKTFANMLILHLLFLAARFLSIKIVSQKPGNCNAFMSCMDCRN